MPSFVSSRKSTAAAPFSAQDLRRLLADELAEALERGRRLLAGAPPLLDEALVERPHGGGVARGVADAELPAGAPRRRARGGGAAAARGGGRRSALQAVHAEGLPLLARPQPLLPQLVEGRCSARSGPGSGSARRCCGSRRWRTAGSSVSTCGLQLRRAASSPAPLKNMSHFTCSWRIATSRWSRSSGRATRLGLAADEDPEERQPQLVARRATFLPSTSTSVPGRSRTSSNRSRSVRASPASKAAWWTRAVRARLLPVDRTSAGRAPAPARTPRPLERVEAHARRGTAAAAGPGRAGRPSRRRGARCPSPPSGPRGADGRRSPAGAPDP